MKIKCPFCLKIFTVDYSNRGNNYDCVCGRSHICQSLDDQNTNIVIDGTSGIITWVKGLGWFLGIICFIAGFSFINDNKSPEIGFLLLINGVILIISGVYLGGIIYLFQQQIKRQNEIIHSIKELNEK
jgi:hypothetical protein